MLVQSLFSPYASMRGASSSSIAFWAIVTCRATCLQTAPRVGAPNAVRAAPLNDAAKPPSRRERGAG